MTVGRICDILIVEDDDSIRSLLADALLQEGYRSRQAGDGVEGLAMARTQRPDVILLDIMMPRLDGNGVLIGLGQDPSLAKVPVIVTSAYPQRLVRTSQVRKVVPKPFDIWELIDVVHEVIGRAPNGATHGAGAS